MPLVCQSMMLIMNLSQVLVGDMSFVSIPKRMTLPAALHPPRTQQVSMVHLLAGPAAHRAAQLLLSGQLTAMRPGPPELSVGR